MAEPNVVEPGVSVPDAIERGARAPRADADPAVAGTAPDRSDGPASGQHVAIITGLSGAGKTAASKIFEDIGYTVVDNVPSELLRDLAELVAGDPERYRRVAIVLDVRSGQRARRARRRARRAARARHRAADRLPRGERRGPHPPLLRDPPPPPARHGERRHRVGDRRASDTCSTTCARWRRPSSTRRSCRSASCASGSSPRSRRSPAPTSSRSRSSASGSSSACRSRPTSSSTCASWRTRSIGPSCGRTRALKPPVQEFVLGQPITQRFLDNLTDYFAFAIPAYLSEGKTRLTDRRRLHRRVPSLGRDRRGPGRAAARAGPRSGQRLAPGAEARVIDRSAESRLARLRRWMRPGTGIKRWLLVMFLGHDCILATAGALAIRHRVPGGARRQPRRAALRARQPQLPARRSSARSSSSGSAPPSSRSASGASSTSCSSRSRRAASRSSSSSTRSARSRAGRASSRSAAAPASRRCCAASSR